MCLQRFLIRFLVLTVLGLFLSASYFPAARAYEDSTLYNGSRGEEVREIQQALIDLGYLNGSADGVFGNKTENAVRAFQKKNKMNVDGLAGAATRDLILRKAQDKKNNTMPTPAPVTTVSVTNPVSEPVSEPASPTAAPVQIQDDGGSASNSFFDSYATIRFGSKGPRVTSLQQALISLGYLSGNADGTFGVKTRKAVKSFQRSRKLKADGVAGKKTLVALESALSGASDSSSVPSSTSTVTPAAATEEADLNPRISAPSDAMIQLLHWFNDVKPSLSGGKRLLIYDPASGLSWTLRIHSCGRHCDAEPLTDRDTRTMVTAFGGVKTWNQKAVYVQLPDGRWSLASTHDMPHDSGTIKDNNFNGHLCVHFLRDMDEAKKNDPKYGVSNQETIRAYWKRLTGEEVP